MWGTWHIISPLSEKVGGRVPHLMRPCVFSMWQDSHKSTQDWKASFWASIDLC